MSWQQKLDELGLSLPDAPQPAGSYTTLKRIGNQFATAGLLPLVPGGVLQSPYEPQSAAEVFAAAAKQTTLVFFALAKEQGFEEFAVDHVRGFFGTHPAAPFDAPHIALNECSNLLVEVLGPASLHTREVVCTHPLPLNAACEIRFEGRVLR